MRYVERDTGGCRRHGAWEGWCLTSWGLDKVARRIEGGRASVGLFKKGRP